MCYLQCFLKDALLKERVKKMNSQQLSELNQHTEGEHDCTESLASKRKINSGFEGSGKPFKKFSADTIRNLNQRGKNNG